MELVVVMALIAILSAVGAARFFSRAQYEEVAFAEELAAAARHAQKVAVSSGCAARLTLTAASVALWQPDTFCSAAFTRAITSPATGQPYATVVPGGLLFGTSAGLPAQITFDAQGGTDLATDLAITVGLRQLTVRRVSGHVQVSP